MTARSEQLAAKVDRIHDDLLAAVESSTPEQWAAPCSDGEWTQGFAAYHAAASIRGITQAVQRIAEGHGFPPTSMDEIDKGNAAQAKEHAGCTKAETVGLIKASAPGAASMVRSLSDDQLDRKVQPPAGMPEMTVEAVVEMVVIGHTVYHLQTITGARAPSAV